MTNRITTKKRIQVIVQEKVEHGGFQEQNAPVKSKTIRTRKPPLEHIIHSGQHGTPYRKK